MIQAFVNKLKARLENQPELSGTDLSRGLAVETPPKISMGELALPIAFSLAKTLKKPPKAIAAELVRPLTEIPGVDHVEVAGSGYLNLYLNRGQWLKTLYQSISEKRFSLIESPSSGNGKIIVEHTNINPNKAAHIGHLRNAVLGDSFVRTLRFLGKQVEVQNYIDNTGVQVADVVVGFQHLLCISPEEALAGEQPFDHFCWDLYAKVTAHFAENPDRLHLRYETLKAIEAGEGEAARIAELVAMRNVRAHLTTMEQLRVHYDLLPRESDILRLHFWARAFQQLKDRGAIQYTEQGKNSGCWIMKLEDTSPGSKGTENADEKVIVRSNGTVTYVGKDIAYQLWKLGLLGRDFHYKPFLEYPDKHVAWVTTSEEPSADSDLKSFGGGEKVYNVIDQRQSYLQDIVVRGLKALQFHHQAANSIHFSYEIVALTPRCCEEMGFKLDETERKKAYVEVAGRKGLGVKADDLLARLREKALDEVVARHDLPGEKSARIADQIAISALRYFLLKFTRNSVIAFDFEEALSFEGETGPYLQYSVVRANNIFRKLAATDSTALREVHRQALQTDFGRWLQENDDIWEVVLLASKLSEVARQVQESLELSIVAKYAFSLAQRFNLFYHRHHILSEENPSKRVFLLLVAEIYRRQMTKTLSILGIEIPERM